MLVRISYVCIAVLLVATMAFAKEGQTLFGMVTKMKAELNLTDEQVKKVMPVLKANMLKRQEYYDSLAGEPISNNKQFRLTSRRLKKEMNAKLKDILTPEQMQKLVEKQNIKESLNKDVIDFSEGLDSGVTLNAQGGSFQF
jgi:Spy/CpxP family protein refolding chaperone